MDNKSNPLDGLVYRLVGDIEGNSFRLENNKGESLQLNLPDGLQFVEQITIPKAIKANERKHMKVNTSRHKNEDNLSQDDLEANSRLVSSALSKLLQAYDAMSDYRTGLGKETNKNVAKQVRESIEEAYNKLVAGVDLDLLACAKENYPKITRGTIGKGHVDFRDMGLNIDVANSIQQMSEQVNNLSQCIGNEWSANTSW